MKYLLIFLLFASFTAYGQSKKDDPIKVEELYSHALTQYLEKYSGVKPADTIFIELKDTLNFNLPTKIRGTVIEVLSFNSLFNRLRNKLNQGYLQLVQYRSQAETHIILFQVSVQYSDDEVVAITDSKIHRITYSRTSNNLFLFKMIESDNNGCRYCHKVRKNGSHSFESICS